MNVNTRLLVCLFSAYEVLSDEKKRRQYDQFGEEGMKSQPDFEGFKFNFDDFFKGFGNFGGFGGGGRGEQNTHGGFKFSFGDFFNDEDDDDFFGFGNRRSSFSANHEFGGDGFGFGNDMFKFEGHQSTFTKTERRSG